MENIQMAKDLEKIVKEGFLEKESRYFKSWRKRWFVLTPYTLYSFKERKIYSNPTEVLPLKSIMTIKSSEDTSFSFRIETVDRQFLLSATSNVQKQQWISQISKVMVKLNSQIDQDQEQ